MKKQMILGFLALSLFILGFMIFGCGTNPTGGGGTPTPVIHTIYSSTTEAPTDTTKGLVVEGTNVYVAFATGASYPDKKLYFYKSTDEAVTLTLVTKEASNVNKCVRAAMTSGNVLKIHYAQYDGSDHIGTSTINTVSGISFETSLDPAGTYKAACVDIASCDDKSKYTVSFTDIYLDYNDTWYSYSGGVSTNDPLFDLHGALNEGGLAIQMPYTSTVEGVVVDHYTITGTSELFFHIWPDIPSGSRTKTLLSSSSTSTEAIKNIDLVADANFSMVSFYKGGSIYAKYSDDTGATWTSDTLAASDAFDDLTSIAQTTSNSYIVYTADGGKDICLAKSADGTTWSTKTIVSLTAGGMKYPEIKCTDDTIYIIYHTSTGVYLLKSADEGATWI